MPRDLRAYLLDLVNECRDIRAYTGGVTLDEYLEDKMRRRAVERSFTIAGEALVRVNRLVPEIAEHLPDARPVIGFRNVLVHNYSVVNETQVWSLSRERVPLLQQQAEVWLSKLENISDEN